MPHAFDAPLGGPRWNIAITFGVEKNYTVWLSDCKKKRLMMCLAVTIQYRRVTDARTDGQTDILRRHIRAMHASRGKSGVEEIRNCRHAPVITE